MMRLGRQQHAYFPSFNVTVGVLRPSHKVAEPGMAFLVVAMLWGGLK
jgi:hypothetical protein